MKFRRNIPLALCLLTLCSCKPVPPKEELRLLLTGDVMLDRGIRSLIERKGVRLLFKGIQKEIDSADAVVINLECPLTTVNEPTAKAFVFRGEPSWADSLNAIGITHACMANNHTYDQGAKGVADTYQNLKKAGIVPLGYGKTETERHRPTLICNGDDCVALFSVTLLGLSGWDNREGESGICHTTPKQLVETIAAYKSAHPHHIIVVIPHWGTEYRQQADEQQRLLADELTKVGASAIVGHHSHVRQNCDTTKGRHIFYSLGNCVFDQNKPLTRQAALVDLHVRQGAIRTRLIPIEIDHFCPIIKNADEDKP